MGAKWGYYLLLLDDRVQWEGKKKKKCSSLFNCCVCRPSYYCCAVYVGEEDGDTGDAGEGETAAAAVTAAVDHRGSGAKVCTDDRVPISGRPRQRPGRPHPRDQPQEQAEQRGRASSDAKRSSSTGREHRFASRPACSRRRQRRHFSTAA